MLSVLSDEGKLKTATCSDSTDKIVVNYQWLIPKVRTLFAE